MGAAVHMICGAPAAGKTTYSDALADRLGGVRFSVDEWMHTLFAPDAPQPMTPAWMWERFSRCEAQIVATALACARRGCPPLLDIGFIRRDQRERVAQRVRAAGLSCELHWLDVDREERWRRTTDRNAAKGATYSFEVTRPMFDYIETIYEPPTPGELAELNGARVGGS
ncbi:hypothetical protein BH09PSE2_BH09PSE2_01260 [soil metagenome]